MDVRTRARNTSHTHTAHTVSPFPPAPGAKGGGGGLGLHRDASLAARRPPPTSGGDTTAVVAVVGDGQQPGWMVMMMMVVDWRVGECVLARVRYRAEGWGRDGRWQRTRTRERGMRSRLGEHESGEPERGSLPAALSPTPNISHPAHPRHLPFPLQVASAVSSPNIRSCASVRPIRRTTSIDPPFSARFYRSIA